MSIPASDVLEFAHVAVPLADIAPYYVHPVIGKSIKEIADGLTRTGLIIQENINLEDVLMNRAV